MGSRRRGHRRAVSYVVVRSRNSFAQHHAALCITFTVILVALLMQGLSLPWLGRRLGAPQHHHTYSEEAVRHVELELDRFDLALDTQLATVQQPEEAGQGNSPT